MFAQLTLAVFMIIKGILHFTKSPHVVTDKVKYVVLDDKMDKYQNRIGFMCIVFSLLFVSMGIIEKLEILNDLYFVLIYIVLGSSLLYITVRINKKYSGKYIIV